MGKAFSLSSDVTSRLTHFCRSHNGMAKDSSLKLANGQSKKPSQAGTNNGGPAFGTHSSYEES